MAWIRAHVAHVAGGWLAFQLCLLAAVPTVLCSPDPLAAAIEAACTCAHGEGEGQSCPMHHSSSSPADDCSCRSMTDPRAAIVASLIGPTAVLAPASVTPVPAIAVSVAPLTGADPVDSVFVPDPPPPRS